MAENMYNWQFNTIPGLAKQGAILMTRNDIIEPPFQQSDFIWKAMEDVIGVANVKFEYDEVNNKYHIYKAKGHQNNQGRWSYTWEEYGTWDALPEEVVETLRAMTYIQYRFVTQDVLGNTVLTIYGVRKTGVEDVIATITFVTKTYVDNTIDALRLNLMTYINKKWEYKGQVSTKTNLPSSASFGDVYAVEDESDLYINISETTTPSWKAFTQIADNFTVYAIELHKGSNGLYAQLRYDSIDFLIDSAQNLKAQIIDDTLDASSPLANRKTYSIDKILQLILQAMRYKGQVNYYDLLPTTGNRAGDTWNVKYSGTSSQGGTDLDGDNYCWNGTSWDNLSGEYRAGVGIQIEGKVISATGISFNVGSGIKITGSGSNAVLETRNGDGLEYQNVGTTANPIYANAVKEGYGIIVDSNGVNVLTTNGIAIDTNNNVVLKHNTDIVINTNNEATVPLKTINGQDLHGIGNIDLSENPIIIAPTNINPSFNSNQVPNIRWYPNLKIASLSGTIFTTSTANTFTYGNILWKYAISGVIPMSYDMWIPIFHGDETIWVTLQRNGDIFVRTTFSVTGANQTIGFSSTIIAY